MEQKISYDTAGKTNWSILSECLFLENNAKSVKTYQSNILPLICRLHAIKSVKKIPDYGINNICRSHKITKHKKLPQNILQL